MYIDALVASCDMEVIKELESKGYGLALCEGRFDLAQGHGIKIIGRKTIRASTMGDITKEIDKARGLFISVAPGSIQVARWAVNLASVHSIHLSSENLELFDKKQLRMMKRRGKPLEVTLATLLSSPLRTRAMIYRRLVLAVREGILIIVGSGAERPGEVLSPQIVPKILRKAYDIPERIGELSISIYPRLVLSKVNLL